MPWGRHTQTHKVVIGWHCEAHTYPNVVVFFWPEGKEEGTTREDAEERQREVCVCVFEVVGVLVWMWGLVIGVAR